MEDPGGAVAGDVYVVARGRQIDGYTFDHLLGVGAGASVYAARHEESGELRAVKILGTHAEGAVAALRTEAQLQIRLRHLNILPLLDVVVVDGRPGLVTEIIDGISLASLMKRARLTSEQADNLVAGILEGVMFAHGKALLHRQLEPGRILLRPEGGDIVPVVTGFGLGPILGGTSGILAMRPDLAFGNPAYMSPEQIDDPGQVDERADVFSLGTILYEMLSGERAFPQEEVYFCWSAIRTGDYPPLAEVAPLLPARMLAAVEGALQPNPGRRIRSVEALWRAWFERVRQVEQKAPATSSSRALDYLVAPAPPTPPPAPPTPQLPFERKNEAIAIHRSEHLVGREGDDDQEPMTDGPTLGQPGAERASADAPIPTVLPPRPVDPPSRLDDSRVASAPVRSLSPQLPAPLPAPPQRWGRGARIAGAAAALTVGVLGIARLEKSQPTPEVEPLAGPRVPPVPDSVAPVRPPPVPVTPVVPSAPVAAAVPTPAPPPAAKPSKPVVERAAPSVRAPPTVRTGRLTVASRPAAAVQLDGGAESAGEGWSEDLGSGRHRLVLTTADGRVHVTSVDVQPGANVSLCWDFDAGTPCR